MRLFPMTRRSYWQTYHTYVELFPLFMRLFSMTRRSYWQTPHTYAELFHSFRFEYILAVKLRVNVSITVKLQISFRRKIYPPFILSLLINWNGFPLENWPKEDKKIIWGNEKVFDCNLLVWWEENFSRLSVSLTDLVTHSPADWPFKSFTEYASHL